MVEYHGGFILIIGIALFLLICGLSCVPTNLDSISDSSATNITEVCQSFDHYNNEQITCSQTNIKNKANKFSLK